MLLWIGLVEAATPSGALLVGAAPGNDGEVVVMAGGFAVERPDSGARLRGGMVEGHIDLHDRATVTIGVAGDVFDSGVLPHFGVRTLAVNQEHVRFGFHLQSGAWYKLSEYDQDDDRTGVGVGWVLEAGGDRVLVDFARTPLAVHSFESSWDGSRYWEPTRGDVQEAGISVLVGDAHRARVGVLGITPVASYTYDAGRWFVRVAGGYAPVSTEWVTYRGAMLSAGVRTELF